MIIKLIDEIRTALDKDLYMLALLSALTIPDICGKIEYPFEQSSRRRYIEWYDKEIGVYEKHPQWVPDEEMPYLSGEIIYSLRCSFLHEGIPNVNNNTLKNSLPINNFTLVIQPKNEWDIYSDTCEIIDNVLEHSRSYCMSIRRICMILCDVGERYYNENKTNFSFDYRIIRKNYDVDEI